MRKFFLGAVAVASFAGAAHAQTLAQVGGVAITLQQVVAADPAAAKDPATRSKVLLALVNRQAVLNEAKSTGIEDTAAYKAALAQAQETIAINLMTKQFADAHKVTDAQITDMYNKIFDKPLPTEYRYREIVVASFSAAQSALGAIKGGKDFSAVAATASQAQSGPLGGEVGWQPEPQVPAPILTTLKSLKTGQVAGPVSIPQGYVVLQLLDKRQTPKPTIDEVRAQLISAIQQHAWIENVIKLRTTQNAHLIVPLSGG